MPGVIDGKRWIAQRLKFLRERLAADPSAEQRAAIEAEIETLSAERRRLGLSRGFPRLPRRRRSD
jgi:hypothetical protein